MGEVNYAPVIREMTWSYSRAKAFDDCPYRWYLRYIRGLHGKTMFFSGYGSFLHQLTEAFLKENLSREQLVSRYLTEFQQHVPGPAPNIKIFQNYFRDGLQYVRTLEPHSLHIIEVEKEIHFTIDGVPIVGILDLIGESNGKLYVVDHKSRNLKPRSGWEKPTKSDQELDQYLTQLYLYAAGVQQEYGRLPDYLCFHCFRSGAFIQEPFQEQAFASSMGWLLLQIKKIQEESDFRPDLEFFKCRYLCEMQDFCEYFSLSR